MLTAVSYDV